MKVVILAGGYGTRLGEESQRRPKPMVEIGNRPILWHIMKIYASHGITEFVVAVGYKGYMIKEFFANYFLHTSDMTFDLANDSVTIHHNYAEPWKVTVVDTGDGTMTGGRLKRVGDYLDDATFCMTYGDGVGNVDISALVDHHRREGVLATLTAVQPPGRFGGVTVERSRVTNFHEKPRGDGGWINGGFFVLEPAVLDYIEGDQTSWELEPLARLASEDQLSAYTHGDFWMPMDTMREKLVLDRLWDSGQAPWKTWA
jgi:glucose-1-phosphate cytidylyltransferase